LTNPFSLLYNNQWPSKGVFCRTSRKKTNTVKTAARNFFPENEFIDDKSLAKRSSKTTGSERRTRKTSKKSQEKTTTRREEEEDEEEGSAEAKKKSQGRGRKRIKRKTFDKCSTNEKTRPGW
jgi:hypothetical protein